MFGRDRTVRSAKAVLVDADGNVLVLRRLRGADLPGGGVDRDERPADAVAREIAEETGLRVDPGRLEAVHAGRRWFDRRLRMVYLSRLPERTPPVTLSDEHSAFEWVAPERFDDLAGSLPTFYRRAVRRLRRTGVI